MFRHVLAAALILFSVCAPASGQSNSYALTRARTLFNQLRDEAQCEAALPSARTFWPSTEFRTLPTEVQQAFLYATMSCAWTLRDGAAAITAANAADALGATWTGYMRMQLGLAFDDNALAIEGFFDFAEQDANGFAEMPARFVFRSLRAAREIDASDATAMRMHDKLLALNYVDPDGFPDDSIRVSHARALLRQGHVEQARQRLGSVIDVRLIVEMRIDRTFDPLRSDAAFEQQFDVAIAAQASLARARQAAADQPRRLGMVLEIAQLLRALGRPQEAIDVLDPAIAAAQEPDADSRFTDVADQLNWLLNEKAYALYDLGRVAEAHQVFGSSIAVGEHGQWSVSQVINFASMLNDEGRGADALAVVRTVGRASPYGDMWAAAVRACGAELSQNAAMRDEAMAFLRAHESDNPAALSQGLLCINDIDAAAALFIRRLGNVDERTEALLALQRYLPRDHSAVPHRALLLERLTTVRDRPDVRAAVDVVGYIEDIPLYTTYWGDV